MKTRVLIGTLVLVLGLVLLGPLAAMADITYDLVVPNTGPTGFASNLNNTPPPYGTVTVHFTDATHATITFETPATTYVPANTTTYTDYYSFISTGIVGVRLSGGNSDGTNISFSNLAAYDENGNDVTAAANITRAYSGNVNNPNYVVTVDGFGFMNLVFDGPQFAGGSAPDIDKIVFDAIISGASWASEDLVLTNNRAGYLAAAHLVADVPGSPGWPPGGVAYTGYAGNGVIPLPPSALLVGTGVLGLVILRKRLK
jgi:hypothetical protein